MARAAGSFNERWQAWSARFAALQRREKVMICGAVAVTILMGGYTLWVEPGELQVARLKKSLDQQKGEQDQLRTQIMALAAKHADPNLANREALEKARGQLAEAEQSLRNFDRLLVAPTQAPQLLQTLLARHRGLKMVSLATLAPRPLIEPPADKNDKGDKGRDEKSQSAPPMPGGNIYKHGVEIKVAGGYLDLLAYVAELESGPQKLLWGDMRLAVKEYPVSELTLTVFTLSLDATWLVV